MKEIRWSLIKPLSDNTLLDAFELKFNYKIPAELRDLIVKYNEGIPEENVFDKPEEGMELHRLLSFEEQRRGGAYTCAQHFIKDGQLRVLPFARDSFGNLICMKDGKVVFWDHELDYGEDDEDGIEPIADSLPEFLEMLHE